MREATVGCSRSELCDLLSRLHRHKDRTYGDAWRRRGEVIAIFSNIARKYDRLEKALSGDRTDLGEEKIGDTTGDLVVYVGKYLTWIAEKDPDAFESVAPHAPAERCTDARGADALEAVFEHLQEIEPAPPEVDAAWELGQDAFASLEVAMMAQTRGDQAAERLDFAEKTAVGWSLLDAGLALLSGLCREDPRYLSEIPRQIAAYEDDDET